MKQSVLLLFSLLLSSLAFSQTEWNVKLHPSAQETRELFQEYTEQSIPLSSLRTQESAFNQLTHIQSVTGLEDCYTLQFQTNENRFASLRQSGLFSLIEPNHQRKLHQTQFTPNDDSLDQQWHHEFIQTFAAWDITQGSKSIKIGILDTGLDYEHPEFEGQIWVNEAEDMNGNGKIDPWPSDSLVNGVLGDFDGIDADGNGYVDDVIGYDFTDQPRSPFGGDYIFPDSDPMDDNAHGTIVAGIAAAKTNNGYGIAGVLPTCEIVVLRAFSASGIGEDDDIARAIVYAADNGIDVINFSFGDIYPSMMMQEAIRYAYAKGVVMVGSAGNGTGDELHYPSGFDEVISVSASSVNFETKREFLWQLSSYGVTVDLCAPGSGIFTTTLRDTADDGTVEAFGQYSGTSAAAPMVAGAAGLLLTQNPSLTPQQIRGILTTSADDISETGWDHFTGAGRLNILKALQTVGGTNVQIISPLNDHGSAENQVAIVGTVLNPEFVEYSLEWKAGTEDAGEWQTILSAQNEQIQNDTLAIWDVSNLADGEYTLRLKADKTDGFSVEDRIRFVRDRTAPEITIIRSVAIWDNDERKWMLVFRDEDQGVHRLKYRLAGNSEWQVMNFDRTTRNGEFLLGRESLKAGEYEYQVEATNLAGLSAQTPIQTFLYQPEVIRLTGFNRLEASMPMGAYLNQLTDFDNDGLKEVIMSRYNQNLSFGKLMLYEYNGITFSPADSLSFKPILIPKDLQDIDNDNLLELLCSVNDSTFILEQASPNEFPSIERYTNFDNGLYPARFGDVNDDGQMELLMKDFRNYMVFNQNGTGFTQGATLADNSPDYVGSIAPRALVDDFDGDGNTETVFGDFDGDFLIYEHTGSDQYQAQFVDTTKLDKAGAFLTQGDFDGDNLPEIFVAVHTSNLRNSDFEYDPTYWWLRIFEATGDNQYEVVWEDYVYDVDEISFNAATAGNVDDDAADELIFSSFPRTYLVEYENGEYGMGWFFYGSLATSHLIGDVNGNGINEFALGRGDTTFWYEKDLAATGPDLVSSLSGQVDGPFQATLEWLDVPSASEYRIWRGSYENPDSVFIFLIDSTDEHFYVDASLTPNVPYLYLLQAKNSNLSPSISPFGNPIVLRAHDLPRIDSIILMSSRQLLIDFSEEVNDRMEDVGKFSVNGVQYAISVVEAGELSDRLVVSFPNDFAEGWNELRIDPSFLDADRAPIHSDDTTTLFFYESPLEDRLILSSWEVLNEKQAILRFNFPCTETALEITNYALSSLGNITAVEWGDAQQQSVVLTIDESVFGATGYSLSVRVTDVVAQNGAQIADNEGNVATFTSFKEDLSKVYVYPNPARPHALFDGVRFANLTQQASVRVFTLSGRFIRSLAETDGDGGLEWNLTDEAGERILPGVYIFRVEAEGVEEFVGKFTVIE